MADISEHADAKLHQERTIWLATVDGSGTPSVRPVWFLWDGRHVLIYSKPTAAKVRHISGNPRVCLHLDPNEWGEDVVIVGGEARVAPEYPRADECSDYIAKYRDALDRFDLTAEQLGNDYSVPIEIEPLRVLTY